MIILRTFCSLVDKHKEKKKREKEIENKNRGGRYLLQGLLGVTDAVVCEMSMSVYVLYDDGTAESGTYVSKRLSV